ncbi:hypothetical protein [Streptococcus hohhotensis]|uniref:Uncharacterized protein n=1 Tax=Streptococcus hohhotensis TaxID=2866998 RepID=A0ABT6QFD0_9STRE|nr:hypothetical protein [Streptococcus sp. IMAU 99199]MDI2140081.1 hypothetical protein [Streptococcus sp. IMAU 99199]
MEVGQVVALLSGAGIGAILSAILVFLSNNKKNQLDYIVKERTEWRKKLEGIIENLQVPSERKGALKRLRALINPYGYNLDIKNTKDYFMKDGHIWDSLAKGKYKDIIYFLSLLLKHDWERRKQEAKFQYLNALSWIVQIFFCVFNFYLIYLVVSNLVGSNLVGSNLVVSNLVVSNLVVSNLVGSNFAQSYISLYFLIYSFLAFMFQREFIGVLKRKSSKNVKGKLLVFLFCFAFPYLINWIIGIVYTTFLKNFSIAIIALLGMYIYEFYYLQLVSNKVEENYVKAIEKFLKKSLKIDNKANTLTNDIIRLESKLYDFENSKVNIGSLEKKRRKLRKKIIKKEQPNIFRHPIRFYLFLKKKKRISKLVLRMLN